MRLVEALGAIVPYNNSLRKNLVYAGYEEKILLKFSGMVTLVSLAAIVVASVISSIYLGVLGTILFASVSFLLVHVVAYLGITFKAENRGAYVDKILPDALQLMSSNVRSGMTMDRAIWASARPEFGPLEKEIKRVSIEMIGSSTISEALFEMTKRIKSASLERAVRLIVDGIGGGGEMAKLLDHIANDIRNFQMIVEENKTSTTTYTIFIIMAALFGAPVLFGISTVFIEAMNNVFASATIPETSSSTITPISSGISSQISTETIRNFSLVSVSIITFFAGILAGLIRTGQEKNGLKYAPFLVVGGILLFLGTRAVLSGLFTSIVPV